MTTDDFEMYNHVELDEMAGALLLHGSLQCSIGNFLDATADMGDLLLVEYTNHAPDGMAATILTATAVATKEAIRRLTALGHACDSALASLVDRMEVDKQKVADAFNALIDESWGKEADETE
jgi:hypothetical protein